MGYDNTNRAVLFKETTKQDGRWDYTGNVNVSGDQFRLCGEIDTSGENPVLKIVAFADQDEVGSGQLNKNEKSKETQPDYRGKIRIDGVDAELAGWKKTSERSGKAFISMSLRVLEETVVESSASTAGNVVEMDDDIPF